MKKLFTALLLSLSLSLSAFAATTFPDISHDELKAAIASGEVTLIDVNGAKSYKAGHIPGALDYSSVAEQLSSKLPANKNALVVAYCGSPKCGAYKKAAEAAAKLGYTNVKHYSGGISGWKSAGEKVQTP